MSRLPICLHYAMIVTLSTRIHDANEPGNHSRRQVAAATVRTAQWSKHRGWVRTKQSFQIKNASNPEETLGTKALHPPSQLNLDETLLFFPLPQLPQKAKSYQHYKSFPNSAQISICTTKVNSKEATSFGPYDEENVFEGEKYVLSEVMAPYCLAGLAFLCQYRITGFLRITNMNHMRGYNHHSIFI